MRRLSIFLSAAMLGLSFGASVWAVSVSPESATLYAEPGEETLHVISIENTSSETVIYRLEFQGIAFGDSADDLRFEPLSAERQSWLGSQFSELEVSANEVESFEVKITPPTTADAEVFAFAVLATPVATADTPGINIASGLASLVFINIGSVQAANLQIESFETIPKNSSKPPIRVATLITNTGLGLAQPKIGVAVTNIWGREVALIPLNPTARRIPGQTNRIFSGEWQSGGLAFGPYTLDLYVFPDDSDKVLTSSLNVVLFPWRLLSILLICGIVFALVIFTYVKTRRRRL